MKDSNQWGFAFDGHTVSAQDPLDMGRTAGAAVNLIVLTESIDQPIVDRAIADDDVLVFPGSDLHETVIVKEHS